MNITLISPPWYYIERLPIVSNNLGIGYIAAYLEAHGHHVYIIDALAEGNTHAVMIPTEYQRKVYRIGLPYNDILSRIPVNTDIIGITAPFNNHARIIQELSCVIKKKYPDIPIVIGGAYPSTLPEYALSNNVDYVIIGEGEIPMLELADGVSQDNIDGLYYHGKKDITPAKVISNLDDIPFPARHLMPVEKYLYTDNLGRRSKHRSLELLTSRGCPFKCTFCATHPVFGYKWRARTVENIIAEIKYLIDKYKVQHINFIDDNLSLDMIRMNALLDRLIDEKLGITWAAVSGLRINTLNKEIIEKIKAANCIRLNLAIESGDMKILKAMNKELNIDKIKEVVSMCNKAGIEPRGYLIIGYPGEDRESFYQTMQFCKELKQLGMKTFILSIAQPYPKTPLWKLCKEKNYLVKENIEDILFFSEYPEPNIITPEFDTQEIQFRFRYAMRYLNPVEYWGNRLLPRAWVKRIIPKEIKDMIIRHT